MAGLRYDGPENMPPGMRRLMEERERKQAERDLRSEPSTARQVSARIPHQSQIGCEEPICASFPPGEAKAPAVQGKPKNVEFDVIYDDGTRRHVTEGVLFEVENERIVFHNGTDRPEVIYATAEAAAEVVGNMNLPIHQLEVVIDRVLQKFDGSED